VQFLGGILRASTLSATDQRGRLADVMHVGNAGAAPASGFSSFSGADALERQRPPERFVPGVIQIPGGEHQLHAGRARAARRRCRNFRVALRSAAQKMGVKLARKFQRRVAAPGRSAGVRLASVGYCQSWIPAMSEDGNNRRKEPVPNHCRNQAHPPAAAHRRRLTSSATPTDSDTETSASLRPYVFQHHREGGKCRVCSRSGTAESVVISHPVGGACRPRTCERW